MHAVEEHIKLALINKQVYTCLNFNLSGGDDSKFSIIRIHTTMNKYELPVRIGKRKLSLLNEFEQLGLIVMVEWRESTNKSCLILSNYSKRKKQLDIETGKIDKQKNS